MPSKKPAAPRKAAVKRVKSGKTPSEPAVVSASEATRVRHIWTLPAAMLMLIVAAGGLWLAVHESSNAPEAASPSASHAAVAAAAAPAPRSAEARPAAPTNLTTSSAPGAHPAEAAAVSITGCLQHGGDGFVLKNAEGSAISKSRSWKSGFLKRTSPSVDLLDAGNAAHLGAHVGQRVTVTGPLAGGEMHVQSLHRVAAACQ